MPIPLAVPNIRGNEWNYVKECLDTNWVSYLGPFVDRFEEALKARCDARHAVVTSSGTAALHLALAVAGVEPDTEVVMPGVTFVAPANAVRYCGAWPAFVDISPEDWQWDISKLADFLENGCELRSSGLWNRITGRRISALLPVHLLGDMCDLDAVCELAARYSLPVVEDAAECLGARYKNREIGAPLADGSPVLRITITSFNGNKIITAGGGGVILANDEPQARRARHLSTTAKADALSYFHDEVGYNYRMTNLAAAVGLAQLEHLDPFLARKRSVAERYRSAFEADSRLVPHPHSRHGTSIFWLYTVMADRPAMPLIRQLNDSGILARPIWTPLYELPAFAGKCHVHCRDFADRLHRHALSLPSSTGITDEEVDTVISALLRIL